MPSPSDFFTRPVHPRQRRYELLRAFFLEGRSASEVARQFGYSPATVYALTRDFRHLDDPAAAFFLSPPRRGRPPVTPAPAVRRQIVALRRRNLSVLDIKARLEATSELALSERTIDRVLKEEGFARLPRRTRAQRQAQAALPPAAPNPVLLDPARKERCQCQSAAGILCLLPYLRHFGIDQVIESAGFPSSADLPPLQSVLAFLALKCASVRRHAADDLWCGDRGQGLFAGLDVLPGSAWLSSYSDCVTAPMNQRLLCALARLWAERGLVSDAASLDVTTLPCWGGDEDRRNYRSRGTRHPAITELPAALAQDPDSGLLLRAAAGIRRESAADSLLDFLAFFRRHGPPVRFLAFDGRFTTYAHLARLDQEGVLFVTTRRRGKRLLEQVRSLAADSIREVRVPLHQGTRLVRAHEARVRLRGYGGQLRQITVLRHPGSRRRPSLLLTNDFDRSLSQFLRRYARRWLGERTMAGPLDVFHLNRPSSSLDIQSDFDLAMTVLAHNLYRLLALQLPARFQRQTASELFDGLLCTGADLTLEPSRCIIALKQKRHLPALLATLDKLPSGPIPWLGNRHLVFRGATRC